MNCPKCGAVGYLVGRNEHFDCGAWINGSGEYHDYEGGCLIERQKQEIEALKSRIKRLESAIEAADKYIHALQDHEGVEYTTWVCNLADARNAYRAAKHEAKESKP